MSHQLTPRTTAEFDGDVVTLEQVAEHCGQPGDDPVERRDTIPVKYAVIDGYRVPEVDRVEADELGLTDGQCQELDEWLGDEFARRSA